MAGSAYGASGRGLRGPAGQGPVTLMEDNILEFIKEKVMVIVLTCEIQDAECVI
jgi:hypothetical protein